ncbi:hypothetical protein IMAU50024_01188 [Lactobacillus helveticus]|uniref:hypothetical protein n=1 Tax=Lactobacillus helveticus TaxID=1587 RepID=UPI00156289F3|nr:hypothetical protein [Lactobacillus helveticus]NRO52642.1 hypothetical protein [Lactobacillus helveticus]
MAKQGTKYEEFCTEVVKRLKEQGDNFLNVKLENIKHDDHIVGKTGVKHQIDIHADYKDKDGKITPIDIECKDYESNVPMEKIATLDSVARDIGAMPVFMAKIGYQSGAQIYAQKLDTPIKTFKVTDPKQASWIEANRIRTIHIQMNSVEYISKGINISLKNEKDEAFSKNVELANASIVDTMSDESIPFEKWVNKTRSNAYHSKKSLYKESLSAGPNQVFLVNNQSIPFIKAEITWQKRSSESNIDISADDLIYGIVEDIESGDWHIAY